MSNTLENVHQLHQDDPFTMNYVDHAKRTESEIYVKSREMLKKIVSSLGEDWFYGDGPYQDHHGGGLWVHDGEKWYMYRNLAGMEWASQFCADPAKVDILRQNARRLYAAFPASKDAFEQMGFTDFQSVLDTSITDAKGVAAWTDSIFNASVPLNQARHTGVIPKGDGVHHYPAPVTDIELFKYDDFKLWVTDSEGQPAAVVPTSTRGERGKSVRVVHATPGTRLHAEHQQARQLGQDLIRGEDDPLAKAAFVHQHRAEAAQKARSAAR